MATIAGENNPCRSAGKAPKRVERRESALYTESTCQKHDGIGRRTKRGCSSKSCEWHLSIARISDGSLPLSPQGAKVAAVLAAKEPIAPLTRTLGGIVVERVRGARPRGRIRDERSPTAYVVAAQYDGRRPGCKLGGS
jgi:hypothetical protein